MHSSCWKLTLYVWICPRDVRSDVLESALSTKPSLPKAREENARSSSIRPTLALKPNGALPRAIGISIFSNDAKKAVLFIGDSSREKDTLAEWQKIP
jgi:hypothetical protein